MSTVMGAGSPANNANDMKLRLEFTKNLNQVNNKIHATSNVDEIMLELSKDICTLFNADRLTIYVVGDDKSFTCLQSKDGAQLFQRPQAAHCRAKSCWLCGRPQETAQHQGCLR